MVYRVKDQVLPAVIARADVKAAMTRSRDSTELAEELRPILHEILEAQRVSLIRRQYFLLEGLVVDDLREEAKRLFRTLFTRPMPELVRNLEEVKPHLTSSGWCFENRAPVQILGITMETVRLRRTGRLSALGFGAGFFHLVQLVRLHRPVTVGELLHFNSTTQMFNLTSSSEPLGAVIKAHAPAHFGVPAKTVLSMLSFAEDAVDELIALVGAENVRI